jgi:hypothetical protein
LNHDRFRETFTLPLPIGHHSRPSPALVNTVYLWVIHLFPSSYAPLQEPTYLQSALHYLSKDLSGSHPQKVVHGIQTEILLSYFYLKNGKVLQGNYHANAALSLSLSAGLHRIRFPEIIPEEDESDGSLGRPDMTLSPSADAIDEVQRIDAFWGVLILNNYWITIQESRYMFYDLTDSGIDTPWPMDLSDYETVTYAFLPKGALN